MTQFITDSIVAAQGVTPTEKWVEEIISTLKFMVSNAFLVVGACFASVFMIVVLHVFVKSLKGLDWSEMFKGDVGREVSLTKFWTNIAYFTATVAFVGKVFMTQGTSDTENMLWLIYLGGVGSNAIASKWLGLKYSDAITSSRGPNPKGSDSESQK